MGKQVNSLRERFDGVSCRGFKNSNDYNTTASAKEPSSSVLHVHVPTFNTLDEEYRLRFIVTSMMNVGTWSSLQL